ncbi:hypothetical protein, partial [Listeria seeligeri]|uniref:hypothetical protein n=1 Tax=Listeria seeligeri TaxID=1640 RepID=UPI001C8A5D1B
TSLFFVENSFLFSALRLPVRLYVSLLFVFFFVQFSKVSFFCCESVLSASATFINIPRFLPFVNTFYKVFLIKMKKDVLDA